MRAGGGDASVIGAELEQNSEGIDIRAALFKPVVLCFQHRILPRQRANEKTPAKVFSLVLLQSEVFVFFHIHPVRLEGGGFAGVARAAFGLVRDTQSEDAFRFVRHVFNRRQR